MAMTTEVGGADDVAAFLTGTVYGGDGWALELAAVSLAVVVLLRYVVVPYASGLIASLSGLHAAFAGVDAAAAGRGAGGLDGATIARLPCFVVARRTGGPGDDGDDDDATAGCAVCLGDVEEGETARALPCCRHAFHARCVDAWLRLRPTCPVCRTTFG